MGVAPETEPPPSTDLEGWRHAVRERYHVRYRLEAIVAAIQDLGTQADTSVRNALAEHVSVSLQSILRKHVSYRLPNKGRDIIERTHGRIIEALLRPTSADGKALRVAFVPRVMFRIRNVIASEARIPWKRTEEEHASSIRNLALDDPSTLHEERMDIERILDGIAHHRKRLAFQLFMDGLPVTSNTSASIVQTLGISENTARAWIKQVREQLSDIPAVQEICEPRGR